MCRSNKSATRAVRPNSSWQPADPGRYPSAHTSPGSTESSCACLWRSGSASWLLGLPTFIRFALEAIAFLLAHFLTGIDKYQKLERSHRLLRHRVSTIRCSVRLLKLTGAALFSGLSTK